MVENNNGTGRIKTIHRMKTNFEIEQIISRICEEYGITADELISDFRYGSLPEARQLYIFVLFSSGIRNKDIAELTGYTPARITLSIQAARETLDSLPYFRQKHDALLKIIC